MHIEAASAERPFRPSEGNQDRLVLLSEIGRFALFDGTGQDFASDLAAKVFIEKHAHNGVNGDCTLPLLRDVFGEIQQQILQENLRVHEKQPELANNWLATTGTAIGIRGMTVEGVKVPTLQHAHAGDSSLWRLDHDKDHLSKVTHDSQVDNFLGWPNHILGDHDWSGFNLLGRTSLALLSDGITSDEMPTGAIEADGLHEILRSDASPQVKANEILAASSVKDDASVIIIETHLETRA